MTSSCNTVSFNSYSILQFKSNNINVYKRCGIFVWMYLLCSVLISKCVVYLSVVNVLVIVDKTMTKSNILSNYCCTKVKVLNEFIKLCITFYCTCVLNDVKMRKQFYQCMLEKYTRNLCCYTSYNSLSN